MSSYDVIVIGGGAAGMMAASVAAGRGKRVLLIEKNKLLGEKLSITGGGRCNILNAEYDTRALLAHFGDSAQFLFSAFFQFGVKDTEAFFESIGVPLVVEDRKRAFPVSQSAEDVTAKLFAHLKAHGVVIRAGLPVVRIYAQNGAIESVLMGGKEYTATSYILATGGVSHPETGSTGDGFRWLRDLGHAVEEPTPTIVPLKTREEWSKVLAGTTLKNVRMHVRLNGERKTTITGDVLLTHFGVSGPTILNAASAISDLMEEGEVQLMIDMRPTTDVGILDKELLVLFEANKNKTLKNALRAVVPGGTVDAILSLVPQIDPEKKVHGVTKDERRAIAELLKALPLTVTGRMGLSRAVVADGGVPLTELDMRTMRSQKLSNLFIVGDLLHIRRPTGGYSLQLCWTTGYVAGMHA